MAHTKHVQKPADCRSHLVKSNPLTICHCSKSLAVFGRTIRQGVANGQRSAFRNAYYAFAILTTRCAHSRRTSARRISVANATTHLIVKIGREMSTIREPLEPKVDVHNCQGVNCCSAFLKVFRLAITANESVCRSVDCCQFERRRCGQGFA